MNKEEFSTEEMIEGMEYDTDVEPTKEEIAEAERMAEMEVAE